MSRKPPAPEPSPVEPEIELETVPLWSWSDAPDQSGEWSTAPLGDRLARGEVLSDGNLSTVQLAEDPLLRRQVVLKSAREDAESASARRLLREARLTAALDHPGVVQVLDAGTDAAGRPWFSMPVVRGRTLTQMRESGESQDVLLGALASAAAVLGHAHAAGIVHRDVKPDNIMVGPHDRVFMLDWGIAGSAHAGSSWDALLTRSMATASGQVLGTPAYMSPEQVIGAAVDARSDVWALGVCLVELVTGVRPFVGTTPVEQMRSVVHAPIPALPGPLGSVVARCLSRDPEDRYADGNAVAEGIVGAIAVQDVPAPAPPATGRPWAPALAVVLTAMGLAMLWLATRAPDVEADTLAVAALRQLAVDAALNHDPASAALLAAEGLKRGDDVRLRGILAGSDLGLEWAGAVPLDDCTLGPIANDGRSLMCVSDTGFSLRSLPDGVEQWSKPFAMEALAFVGSRVVAVSKNTLKFHSFDRETGAGLGDMAFRQLRPERLIEGNSNELVSSSTSEVVEVANLQEGWSRYRQASSSLLVMMADGRALIAQRQKLSIFDANLVEELLVIDRVATDPADSPWVMVTSADERWVIEGSLSGVVRTWDLRQRRVVERVQLPPGMVSVAMSRGPSPWVAVVDELGAAWVWPAGQGSARMRLPGKARVVGFPEPNLLAVIDDSITRWRLPEPGLVGVMGTGSGVSGVDWRGDWLAASVGEGALLRIDTRTGTKERALLVPGRVAKDVALGPEGQVLGAQLGVKEERKTGQVFWPTAPAAPPALACRRVVWLEGDIGVCQSQTRGPTVFSLQGQTWPELGVSFGVGVDTEPVPGRRKAVIRFDSGEVYTVESGDPPVLAQLTKGEQGGAVAMGPEDQGLVFFGGPSGVEVQDLTGVSLARVLATPSEPIDIAVSPAGDRVAAGLRNGEIWVWARDLSAGAPASGELALELVLIGHRERVSGLAFSDDGRRLASGSWDETLRIWDVSSAALSPDVLIHATEERWHRTGEDLLGPNH